MSNVRCPRAGPSLAAAYRSRKAFARLSSHQSNSLRPEPSPISRWVNEIDALPEVTIQGQVEKSHIVLASRALPPWAPRLGDEAYSKPDAAHSLPVFWHILLEPPWSQNLQEEGTSDTTLTPPYGTDTQRRWASGSVEFHDTDLHIGQPYTITSKVEAASEKIGRTGASNLFVTVKREYNTDRGLAVTDRRTHVYLVPPPASLSDKDARPDSKPGSSNLRIMESWTPTIVDLFRFSAITHNPHRIHYDQQFCVEVARVPAPLVHGPLNALLLAGLSHRWWRDKMSLEHRPGHHVRLKSFKYRATAPLMVNRPLEYCVGHTGEVCVRDSLSGVIGMTAKSDVVWSPG